MGMVSRSTSRLLDVLFSLFPEEIFRQDFPIIFQLYLRNRFYTSKFNRYLEWTKRIGVMKRHDVHSLFLITVAL